MSDSFATSWTVARQAPLSMGFCRQEHWSELPFPPPGDLPNPGIIAGRFFTTEPPEKPLESIRWIEILNQVVRVSLFEVKPTREKAGTNDVF